AGKFSRDQRVNTTTDHLRIGIDGSSVYPRQNGNLTCHPLTNGLCVVEVRSPGCIAAFSLSWQARFPLGCDLELAVLNKLPAATTAHLTTRSLRNYATPHQDNHIKTNSAFNRDGAADRQHRRFIAGQLCRHLLNQDDPLLFRIADRESRP